MIRVMFDSDVLADLPARQAPLLATYSDLIADSAQMTALQRNHPGSKIILIDRGLGEPWQLGSVADVETGALKPGDLPAWFDHHTQRNVEYLTVYSDRSDLDAIDAALKGTGHENHWRWIATLDGTTDIAGFKPLQRPAAVQILGAGKLGIRCDLSLVLEDGWHAE